MTIRLLIADDHAMVRKGLQVFLATQPDLEVVGEASNGQEALEQADLLRPHVILMDLHMPLLSGIETASRLRVSQPEIKVIVLTSFADQEHVVPAIRAGVKGYLLKEIEPDELMRAIRRVHAGQVELHPAAAEQLMQVMATPAAAVDSVPRSGEERKEVASAQGLEQLTKREREVLGLIAHGMSNKDIAQQLIITEKTVKTHVSHILDKLEVADRTQAAIYAVKSGWMSDQKSN
ncbi:response regulator [Paenibacillus massiliensis]|uniref:response regulator n=1 Tax=Paenibacillus massiliensis TaxID=225917 RepID=UPI000361E1F7|nr:response regulator transcription factor [Paenibacillus massiliensis]